VSLSLASYISQFDAVQTNRLHIAILAAKLGKEVRLFPNSYYKIKAVFDHSFHESFDRVHFHYECSGKVEKPSAISSTIVAEQLQGELRNSVEWLEQQRSAWEQEAKTKAAEFERLALAMRDLQQSNAWLEQQRSAWEQEAKMKVAELERLSVAMKEPKQENADK
jgi:hypothetical protein